MKLKTKHEALQALSPQAAIIWNAVHPDYRTYRADGILCVMHLNETTGATSLQAVESLVAENSRG